MFNKNFFKDWRKVMTEKEKEKIRDLSKCDFTEINTYFKKVRFDFNHLVLEMERSWARARRLKP